MFVKELCQQNMRLLNLIARDSTDIHTLFIFHDCQRSLLLSIENIKGLNKVYKFICRNKRLWIVKPLFSRVIIYVLMQADG